MAFAAILFSSCLTRPERFSPKKSRHITPSGSTSSNSGNILATYAQLLGVENLSDGKLYTFIDDWMGAPHRMGGGTKNGVDCSGFIDLLFEDVYQKELPRTSYEMAEVVKRKYEKQLKEGDLVFFSFGKKSVDHVGIYLANNKFAHVSTSKGVIISDLHDPWYYKYFVRCGSIR